ncbi:cysteine hydrolase family protein [Nocardioides sp. R-C-SC26]|uniref:cysteine hydrolase family protein n=1 Tax=Nocardioides sp. R-C-SC26 TaxID=2870414 RepID=UPI001E2FF423|nr:isochorismatase family cysteine hydrolase [Nocardioides sp. R-C-SC26]
MAPTRALPPDGDVGREALVLVDLQTEFFADPQMAPHRMGVVRAVNALAASARTAGHLIVEVRTLHHPDGSTWTMDMREDSEPRAVRGTPGAVALPELALEGAVLVPKARNSAFHGTDLGELLSTAGVRRVVLAGVSAETCIYATASDAYARDLRVTLADEAIASTDEARRRRALEELRVQYRQPLCSVREIVRTWTPSTRQYGGSDVALSS